jgi:type I restriction enzyme S subunit
MSDCSILVSTGPFGSLLHKSDYVSDGIPVVNPINIVQSEIVPDENKLVSSKTQERLKAYILQEGDVVVARRGEIGRCAVIGKVQSGWVCGTGCFFIRPKAEVDSYFLAMLIQSHRYRRVLEDQATGTTMNNLSNKTLAELRIRLPSKAKQESIIEMLRGLSQQTSNLESIYQQKLATLSELKQSLLRKAFSGELTAEDRNVKEAAA